MSLESHIQTSIRLRLSAMRNNLFLRFQVGTFLTMDGRPVKIGQPGVSDLIGIIPHVVTQEDVGRTIGVFVAMEVKQEKDGTAKERKLSQGNFRRLVNSLGGLAGIVRSEADAESIVKNKWNSDKLG